MAAAVSSDAGPAKTFPELGRGAMHVMTRFVVGGRSSTINS
jgi:hypothetical protein